MDTAKSPEFKENPGQFGDRMRDFVVGALGENHPVTDPDTDQDQLVSATLSLLGLFRDNAARHSSLSDDETSRLSDLATHYLCGMPQPDEAAIYEQYGSRPQTALEKIKGVIGAVSSSTLAKVKYIEQPVAGTVERPDRSPPDTPQKTALQKPTPKDTKETAGDETFPFPYPPNERKIRGREKPEYTVRMDAAHALRNVYGDSPQVRRALRKQRTGSAGSSKDPRRQLSNEIETYRRFEEFRDAEKQALYASLDKGITLWNQLRQEGRESISDTDRRIFIEAAASREVLHNCNLRLVEKRVRSDQPSEAWVDDVLVGAGGLDKGIVLFDRHRGVTLATFVTPWIRSVLQRNGSMATSHVIGLSDNDRVRLSSVQRARDHLRHELDRSPTTEEIAEETGFQPELVEYLAKHSRPVASLDQPLTEDSATTLGDMLASNTSEPGNDFIEAEAIRQTIEGALQEGVLTQQEASAFILRFFREEDGKIIIADEPLTYEETGNLMGYSRSLVGNLIQDALRKLGPYAAEQLHGLPSDPDPDTAGAQRDPADAHTKARPFQHIANNLPGPSAPQSLVQKADIKLDPDILFPRRDRPLLPDIDQFLENRPELRSIAASYEALGLGLRDDQLEATHALEEAIKASKERLLFEMYPGGGKTNVVGLTLHRWLTDNPDGRILYLCDRANLIHQARERFETIFGDRYSHATLTGKSKELEDATFRYATIPLLQQSEWRDFIAAQRIDAVIVDESHHSKAVTHEELLDFLLPSVDFAIGMSGTIRRLDMRDIREIYDKPEYSKPFAEAVREGRLAEPIYLDMTNPDEAALLHAEGISVRKGVVLPQRDEQIVRTALAVNEAFAAHYNVPLRTLVFTNAISRAKDIAALWPDAQPLHYKKPDALGGFANGEFSTLVPVDMIREGADLPDVTSVVLTDGTDSEARFVQEISRGLRRTPGKEVCLIQDYGGNYRRIFGNVEGDSSGPAPFTIHGNGRVQAPSRTGRIYLESNTFSFSPKPVDFVKRAQELGKDPMPIGAITLERYAKDRKKHPQTVDRLARSLHMVIMMRPRRKGVRWLPTEYQRELDAQPSMQIPSAEPDQIRLAQAARILDVSLGVATRALKDLGIEPTVRQFDDDVQPGWAISEDDIERLQTAERVVRHLETRPQEPLPPLAEGEESVRQAARSLNMARETFLQKLEEHGIHEEDLLERSIEGQPARAVTKAQKNLVADTRLAESASEESRLLRDLADERGMSVEKLRAIADEQGIEIENTKGSHHIGERIKPDDIPTLDAHSYFSTPKASDTVKSLNQARKILGIGMGALRDEMAAADLPIAGTFRFGSNESPGITVNDINQLGRKLYGKAWKDLVMPKQP